MKAIQFNAIVGADQVIRPPAGVALPVGEMEVSVRPHDASLPVDSIAATRSWLLQLAQEAELAKPDLPSDMSINHDYYVHGKPRK